MLKVDSICKKYKTINILKNISFTLEYGECICIAGSNGAGKSTLLSIIAGTLKQDSGNVIISRNKKIGYVPQDNILFDNMSVRDNLLFWYSAHGLSKKNIFCEKSIEFLLGLKPYEKSIINNLSEGLKKRLSIAIALCNNPNYIVLDEPCNGLDIVYKNETIEYLNLLKSMGIGIILSTHSSYEIKCLCDKLIILKNGQAFIYENITNVIQDKNIDFDSYLVEHIK